MVMFSCDDCNVHYKTQKGLDSHNEKHLQINLSTQALEAMKLEKQQQMSLKNQAFTTILAKQGMEAMGWKFDPNKSRAEQIKGIASCTVEFAFSNTITIE